MGNVIGSVFCFQAEDGIRDGRVTGVQTCALPISRRALSALAEAGDATDWQLHTDARLCQAEALRAIGSSEEADAIIADERRVITAHRDAHRLERLRALEGGRPFSVGRGDVDAAVRVHLRLADRALRAARGADALEHYRAARVLLEV